MLTVNEPPLEPTTLAPTLPATPLTAPTVSVSPSGSVSLVITLPDAVAFSVVEFVLALAVGAGFVTVQTKVCAVAAPFGSVPVIVTLYGPPTLALAAIVPVMTPVVGWMLKPGGRLLALKVNVSLPSASAKLLLTSRVTTALSLFV